ncbi:MAG: hypothetical protein JO042_16685 [Sinobacteraceae bacterium]|nr:hypothetical protein [Nevskiaceae bacterium]
MTPNLHAQDQPAPQGPPPTGPPPTNPQAPAPPPPEQPTPQPEPTLPQTPAPSEAVDRWHWLDETRQKVYDTLWHTAMRVDRWFGSTEPESEYKNVYGSIAPAVLWDQHYGFSEPFRFNVNLPLPAIDNRLHAYVGRFDPNELVSESSEPSGAFRRQYGPVTQDQTLFGLAFHQPPKQGGYFDAGAGIRVSLPLDPYLKGSYVYDRGTSESGLFTLRETGFWQHSQGFGVTSRTDFERIFELKWLARWTGSVSLSQKTEGVSWWSAADLMRGFPNRRAIAFELESDGQTDAPVPLHNYGGKFAYRRSVIRKWLIMEVRTSMSWPKDFPWQHRKASPGVGVGFEMLLGTDEFLARPVTF